MSERAPTGGPFEHGGPPAASLRPAKREKVRVVTSQKRDNQGMTVGFFVDRDPTKGFTVHYPWDQIAALVAMDCEIVE